MNVRNALRAASQSPALHGVRPRVFGQRAWLAFFFLATGGSMLVIHFLGDATSFYALPLLGFVFAASMAPIAWNRSSTVEHNAAVDAMNHGRLDEAERRLVAFFRYPRLDHLAAFSLHQLGVLVLRRRRFAEAIPLFRAASVLENARLLASAGSLGGHARAWLAVTLIGEGDLNGASETLATPEPKGAFPSGRAILACARALLALRMNDAGGALRILETNRRLIQNVLTGNDAALAEVLEASALTALAATPGGTPRAAHPVVVDAEARAFVMRLLPDCEPLLLDEAF